ARHWPWFSVAHECLLACRTSPRGSVYGVPGDFSVARHSVRIELGGQTICDQRAARVAQQHHGSHYSRSTLTDAETPTGHLSGNSPSTSGRSPSGSPPPAQSP